MDGILKGARVEPGGGLGDGVMVAINAQALRTLTADEVFVFRVAACDDQVDRDFERFTVETLHQMMPLFVGKPILMDHSWSASAQTARIFAAEVETGRDRTRLVLSAYMLRTAESSSVVAAIEAGVMREVSVGVSVGKTTCSICGQDGHTCPHRPGDSYHDGVCHMELSQPLDAYEVSFVAVPAQPGAGVIKRYGDKPQADKPAVETALEDAVLLAQARLDMEKVRYGGMNA